MVRVQVVVIPVVERLVNGVAIQLMAAAVVRTIMEQIQAIRQEIVLAMDR